MSDLGALLRKAREQRGYTLEDIQEITKIRKRYLEAIETGDYKVLPGSFYVRAFVKTYAETVGLDAEEVLRLYQKELPKPAASENVSQDPMLKPSRRSSQNSDRWGKVSVTMLMWLFPIVILVVVYVYWNNNYNKPPAELNPGKITNETAAPTPSPTASASPSATPTPTPQAVSFQSKGKNGVTELIEVSPGGTHKLQIDITGECWFEVRLNDRNGKVLVSKSVAQSQAPQTVSFDMNVPLWVNAGRADNTKMTIDGVLFPDGDSSNAVKFQFATVAKP